MDKWQAWQVAAALDGYDISLEVAAPAAEEPDMPPGMSDSENDSAQDDSVQWLREQAKVHTHILVSSFAALQKSSCCLDSEASLFGCQTRLLPC